MARAIATEERVFATADALLAGGEEPSIIAIQERIGGSYTTIKRYLDMWHARRATPPAPDLPPDLLAKGTALIQSIWATAHGLAEHAVNQARQEAEAQVHQAHQALHAAETTIQRLETAVEEHEHRLAVLHHERDELHTSLESARTATQVAEARATEQARQLDSLRQQLDRQAAELIALQQQIIDHARISGELDATRQQLHEQIALIERISK